MTGCALWERFPTMIAVAHGSTDPGAERNIASLLDSVRRIRPGLRVEGAFLEFGTPRFREVLERLAPENPIVVPLLLSRGYHIYQDISALCGPMGVEMAGPMGPAWELIEVLAQRLARVRAPFDTPMFLVGAGSSLEGSSADAGMVAEMLGRRLGRDVSVAFIAGAEPSISSVVQHHGERGSVIASYLLSPGKFQSYLESLNGYRVTGALGHHHLISELVLRRYDEAVASAFSCRGKRNVPRTGGSENSLASTGGDR